jgi:uncharacterized protein DUF3300
MSILKQIQAVVLSFTITMMVVPGFAASPGGTAAPAYQEPAPTSATPSAKELQQLVAPIALYPDNLVAQILAGSTYPTQVVEAERWVKEHQNLKGSQLAQAVDQQPWDPSIKALAEFPQVLQNMSSNLSWTSALGEAYTSDAHGVMSAIQGLRMDAQHAGNLKSTEQQTVSTQGQTIVIEPANPEVVYVPSYSPEVYGVPVAAYPGYSGWGAVAAGAISFGAGMAVGAAFGGYGWGWNSWGANWHGGNVTYNRNTFVSNSNTFANRNLTNVNRQAANLARNPANRGAYDANRANLNQARAGDFNRGTLNKPGAGQVNRSDFANRGFGSADRSTIGRSSGSFGGFSQGGAARADSFRGASSFGGGGGFRGGGGGRR